VVRASSFERRCTFCFGLLQFLQAARGDITTRLGAISSAFGSIPWKPLDLAAGDTPLAQSARVLHGEHGGVADHRAKWRSIMQTNNNEAAEVGLGSGRDSLPDTFVPEALLPEQYFDRWAARASDSPEKRLMFAVLLDAVIQLQGRNQKDAAEAEEWIRAEHGDESPFSFRNICEALGIETGYLARGLLSWRERHASTPYRAPLRQLRTSHTHVTPLRRRRRRRGLALAS